MTDKELKKLLEAQKRATRQVQFFLDREREVTTDYRNEVKESNEDYQETIRELRREIAGLKHEIIHLTGTQNRLTRSK